MVTAFLHCWWAFLVTDKSIMCTWKIVLKKCSQRNNTPKKTKNLGAIIFQHEGACCIVMLQAKCNEAVMCGLLCQLCLMTAQRCHCIHTMNWEKRQRERKKNGMQFRRGSRLIFCTGPYLCTNIQTQSCCHLEGNLPLYRNHLEKETCHELKCF